MGDGREDQTRNPKHQAPEKFQAPNPKCRIDTAELGFEILSFFGVGSLVLGAFIRISALPWDRLSRRDARVGSRRPMPRAEEARSRKRTSAGQLPSLRKADWRAIA